MTLMGARLSRLLGIFLGLIVGLEGTALATTTNDAVRSAMLKPLIGKYTCSDTGPGDRPYIAVVKGEGGWIVWREHKDDPSTEYLQWDPHQHAYIVLEVESGGGYSVSTTTDADPLNATWKHQYPVTDVYGPMHTTFANNVFTVAVQFHYNGKTRIGRLACKKS